MAAGSRPVPGRPRVTMPARERPRLGRVRCRRVARRRRRSLLRSLRREPRVAEPSLVIDRFEDLIALAAQRRDVGVKVALERDVRLVSCEDGRLEITLEKSAAKTLVNDLARKFSQWTNRRWMVVVSAEQGRPTVKAQNDARQAELEIGVRADPLVQAVLARFPGAEIISVREAEQPAVLSTGEPDEVMPEPPPVDDVFAYGAPERLDDEDR